MISYAELTLIILVIGLLTMVAIGIMVLGLSLVRPFERRRRH